MKNRKLAFLAAGIALSVISCQKEEEAIDMEAPNVTLSLSGKAEKLYNEVVLTSTATDNGAIEKVEFFLNDQSLGEDREAPYEIRWNSKDVEDGTYMLKAVASDNVGLKAEAAQEVSVKNTLFVVNVEDGYLKETENRESVEWIFLSDNNGNVVGAPQQVINGTILNWQRPEDFNSDIIYLNRLFYNYSFYEWSQKPYKYLQVSTYSNYALESINLKAGSSYVDPEYAGRAEINIENDFPDPEFYNFVTRTPYGGNRFSSGENTGVYNVTLYEDELKGLSTYQKNEYDYMERGDKYYRLDYLKVGGTYNFHSSDYAPMVKQNIQIPSSYSLFSFSVGGFLNEGDTRSYPLDYFYASDNETSDVNIYYADDFHHYRTAINLYSTNSRYYTYRIGDVPESFTRPTFSASVNRANHNNSFQVTTRGDYDVAGSYWTRLIDDETQYYRIRRALFFSNDSDLIYTLPDIPSSLVELYPELESQMEYDFVYVLDHNHISTYDELIAYWFRDTATDPNYTGYSSIYLYPSEEGARMKSGQNKLSPEEEQEQENLRARGMLNY